ncbi:MAG TPA: alpha/beta hydrolase [Steroidobacteraceae bacterium]|nr:alpha/beta hydrolase [Steroidobacteraceae bacterium]
MTWCESGGTGSRAILLLHGLGATAAVWDGVRQEIEQRAIGRWFAPDLGGHGGTAWQRAYTVGGHADEVAELVRGTQELFVVGHSLGAYIALALASRWFGVEVAGVLGIGPKITWSQADLQGARELAARPVRWYATAEEAWARYRRVSGLDATVAPKEEWLARGVVHAVEGWRLAQDPRSFAVAGAPFDSLVASARARVILARGERDAMVSTPELRAHVSQAVEIAGSGHNVQVEKPDAIVDLLQTLIA